MDNGKTFGSIIERECRKLSYLESITVPLTREECVLIFMSVNGSEHNQIGKGLLAKVREAIEEFDRQDRLEAVNTILNSDGLTNVGETVQFLNKLNAVGWDVVRKQP